LQWTPAKNATSYTVKRATVKGGPYATVASKLTQPNWTDERVAAGTKYRYIVYSVHGRVGGPRSSEISVRVLAPPASPGGLAVACRAGSLELTWTPSPGATGYKVLRSDAGAAMRTIGDTSDAKYEDRDVEPMIEYRYAVKAVNVAGESGDSAPSAGSL